jgi:hypothetical protein
MDVHSTPTKNAHATGCQANMAKPASLGVLADANAPSLDPLPPLQQFAVKNGSSSLDLNGTTMEPKVSDTQEENKRIMNQHSMCGGARPTPTSRAAAAPGVMSIWNTSSMLIPKAGIGVAAVWTTPAPTAAAAAGGGTFSFQPPCQPRRLRTKRRKQPKKQK